MSLTILHPPPGAIDGAELQRRLIASGWSLVPRRDPGFVSYRCPVVYEHDRPTDDPHRPVGSDGHRIVSWDPSCMFSTWHAVREILELQSWIGRPIVDALTFVPWIAAEIPIPHSGCFTCGASARRGEVDTLVRLSGHAGGGEWICVACADRVTAAVAKLRGAL